MSENTASEKLSKFEEILNEYIAKVGLDKIVYNPEVEKVLSLNEAQLKNLDKIGLNEYSFLLAQYCAVLTKEINRNKVRLNYAENQLSMLIAKAYDQNSSQYVKYDVVRANIINNNSAAQVLNNIILHAKSRILETEDIVSSVMMMSKILNTLVR